MSHINTYHNFIKEQFINIGIKLNDDQINKFITYYEMLIEKNKVVNLTAITDFKEVVVKHFVDSVLAYKVKNFNSKLSFKSLKIIDVGTGAGFPGIPLKIVFDNLNLTLLDSLNKRVVFLQEVVDKLNLQNVECVHGRAEDFGCNKDYREKYDICVSRAVSNLSTLSEYCVPFIKNNGIFISYKTANAVEEIENAGNALRLLNCNLKSIQDFELSGIEDKYIRKYVVITKKGSLSNKYPRKAGLPSKNPL